MNSTKKFILSLLIIAGALTVGQMVYASSSTLSVLPAISNNNILWLSTDGFLYQSDPTGKNSAKLILN